MNALVIATYNESLNAPSLVKEIRRELGDDILIIVVDDNSPDKTAQALEELKDPRLDVLVRRNQRGYGTAVRDGLVYAVKKGARKVVTMDSDFSHEPKSLAEMFAALDEADLVIGSRYINGVRVINWQAKRLLLSLFANFYVRKVLGLKTHDCTSGFRGYRSKLIKKMNLSTIRSNGYSFLVEMLWRGCCRKARVEEVPIIFVERREGESKMSGGVIFESVLMPWRLRFFK
jgi:dolichol-phosphate mannosyltransferase